MNRETITEIITVDHGNCEIGEPGRNQWSYERPVWSGDFPLVMGYTQRFGGVSEAPFDSLNLAFHVGDDPNRVRKNRALVARYLGVAPERITCADQVHGIKAVRITEDMIGAGATDQASAVPACDALYTDIPEVPVLLLTADCVGVAVYDPVHHALGVVHAGWRGAIQHLSVITVHRMREAFGTRFEDCRICLGPSIGPESFEVGEDLSTRFSETWTDMTGRNSSDIIRYRYNPEKETDTPHVDLWAFIREDLKNAGVPESQICIGGTDTVCSTEYFSYRRDGGTTGRMALFAMLRRRK